LRAVAVRGPPLPLLAAETFNPPPSAPMDEDRLHEEPSPAFGARAAYAAASLDAARVRKLVGLEAPYGKDCQRPSSPTAISNDEAGICSSSRPVWRRRLFSSTTLHSSTGSGENGRRGTCCRLRTVLRGASHSRRDRIELDGHFPPVRGAPLDAACPKGSGSTCPVDEALL
jgi:hypothetical protein